MGPTDILTKSTKQPSRIHWIFISIVGLETLLADIYFPGWGLPIVATTMPAAFIVTYRKRLYRNVAYWMLIVAFTFLFWVINVRLKAWMNDVGGILSLALVGGSELLALAAVIVRVFPEPNKR